MSKWPLTTTTTMAIMPPRLGLHKRKERASIKKEAFAELGIIG